MIPRRSLSLAVVVGLVVWLGCAAGPGLRAASDFDQARKAYDQGDFPAAVAGFERALQGAPGGVGVLYNLGNARFRQGEMGRALSAWRQAEGITPRDPALRHNLDLIRRRLGQPPAPIWRRWVGMLTLDEWALGAVGLVWLWAAWTAWVRLKPEHARAGSGLRAVLCGATGLVVAAWLTAWVSVVRGPNAAIAGREVPARFGPLEESEIAVTYADGAEVRIVQRRNEWVRVVDADGRGGWVSGLQLARYHPTIP